MARALENRKNTRLNWSVLFSLLVFLLVLFLELELLINHPWSGLELVRSHDESGLLVDTVTHPDLQDKLHTNDRVVALKSNEHSYLQLTAQTIIDDPDNYPTLEQYDAAFKHNAALYERIINSQVTLKTATGQEISFSPLPERPVSSLPLNFWVTNFTAFIGLLFASLIWAYKQQNLTTRLLFFSGLFFAIASSASAVYASRSLALDPYWYSLLTAINHLAMPIVAFSLLALILVYPQRLIKPAFAIGLLIIPVVIWINCQFRFANLPFHTFYLSMIVAFLCGIPPAIKQWQLTKNKPLERAALKWMILSIFIATGSEIVLYFLPTIFNEPPFLPLWLAQLIFLPLYIGFFLGVFKYRLFDVERWWLISWHWVFSGLLIVCIDLLLVWLLHLNPLGALSIAIIIMAWGYFPMREWFWKKIGKTPEAHLENHIHDLIRVFIGNSRHQNIQQRWRILLEQIFSTSSAEIAGNQIDAPCIQEQGMNLLAPGINGNYHIDLFGKNENSQLFNQHDIEIVKTLMELATHTQKLRAAEEKGIQQERQRIMRDLHDDVGANLLSMIYRAKDQQAVVLAQDTLKMLRETIYTLDDNSTTQLTSAIAKWRQEIQQRCHSSDIDLIWNVDNHYPKHYLTARQLVNLGRILRESLSNAITHAKPSFFSLRFEIIEKQLTIQINHDGDIAPPDTWQDGKGIPSIKARVNELHGTIEWLLTDKLHTTILIPLNKERSYDTTT